MIRSRVILICISLTWYLPLKAQFLGFKERLEYQSNDVSLNTGISVCSDSTYLLFGAMETQLSNDRNASIIRVNAYGVGIDTLIFGFPSQRIEIKGLFKLSAGYLAVGHIWGVTTVNRFDPFLIRLKDDLDTLWTKKIFIGNDTLPFVSSAILCSDSTIAISGMVNDSMNIDQNIMFLRIDTLGNIITFKSLGWPNSNDRNYFDLDQTLDGGFVIAGTTTQFHPFGSSGYTKQIAFKLDAFGNIEWWHYLGRNDATNGGCRVKALEDSTIFIYSAIPIASGLSGPYKWYIKKLNYQNQQIWYQEYPEIEDYPGVGPILELDDHKLVMTRTKYSEAKPILVKFDSLGNYIWQRDLRWGFGNHAGVFLTEVSFDNGFAISGFYQPNYVLGETGSQDLYLIKTNCLGFTDPPVSAFALENPGNYQVQLENNSEFFGMCIVDWGDGFTDTLYETSDTLIWHTYPGTGTYSITFVALACDISDTLSVSYTPTITGITEYRNTGIRVWPNPTNSYLNIQFESSVSDAVIIVYDMTGKKQFEKAIAGNVDYELLDMQNLSSGVYFLSIQIGNLAPVFEKIVKQ